MWGATVNLLQCSAATSYISCGRLYCQSKLFCQFLLQLRQTLAIQTAVIMSNDPIIITQNVRSSCTTLDTQASLCGYILHYWQRIYNCKLCIHGCSPQFLHQAIGLFRYCLGWLPSHIYQHHNIRLVEELVANMEVS